MVIIYYRINTILNFQIPNPILNSQLLILIFSLGILRERRIENRKWRILKGGEYFMANLN